MKKIFKNGNYIEINLGLGGSPKRFTIGSRFSENNESFTIVETERGDSFSIAFSDITNWNNEQGLPYSIDSLRLFLISNTGQSGGGSGSGTSGIIDVSKTHRFLGANLAACRTARDNYFTQKPEELITNTYIVLEPTDKAPDITLERYSGIAWLDVTEAIKGEKGDKGDAGGGLIKVGFIDDPSNTAEVEFMLFNKENFNLAVEGVGQNGKAKIAIKDAGRSVYNIVGESQVKDFTITDELTEKYNYFNVLTREFFSKFLITLNTPTENSKDFILNISDFSNSQPFLEINGDEIELIFGMQMYIKPNNDTGQWEFYLTRIPFYVYEDSRYLDGTNEIWDIESGNRTAAISRGTLTNWIPEINGKRGMVMVHLMGLKSTGTTTDQRGRTFLYNILLDDGTSYHFVRTGNGETMKDQKLKQIYIDPKEGFKLNHDGIVSGTLQDGTKVDLIKAASGASNLLFGDTKASVILETKDGKAYVSDGLEVKKILLEGEDPAGHDPSEGFDLKTGKKINIKDGSAINLESGGDFTFDFGGENHNLIQTDANGIVIGSNQSDANVELRTKGGKIKAQVKGSEENIAFESNTLGNITAGSNITINKDDPRNPVISSTGGTGGGSTIDKDNPLEVKANDGSTHDAIAINSTDDLVIGTRSETIKSLHLATGATQIGVYRKDSKTGVEIVDRVVMASELDQFKGLDDYFIEAGKVDNQVMKGTHPETAKEVFSGVDDVFMWKYSNYTYMMPLSFVSRKGSVSVQAGTIVHNSQTNTFTLNASGAESSVTDLGYTIGGGASAVRGDETIPITYNSVLTSENSLAAGTYQFKGASKADLFTFQWTKSSADTVTVPLAIVPDGGSYIIGGTNNRVKLINTEAGYELETNSSISDVGFMGYTVGYNQGSNNVSVNRATGTRTLYLRGANYTITEQDIQKNIVIQAEPFVKDADENYSTTVTFPSLDVMKKYYYIPSLNEDMKNILPHIMNLNIQVWIDPEEGRSDKEHRLYLKSDGNSFAWGTTTSIGDVQGCFIHRPPNDTSRNDFVSFSFMKIEESGGTIGVMGDYTLQSSDEDNVFSLTTTPPAPNPPASPIVPDSHTVEIDATEGDSYVIDIFDVTSEYVTEFIATTKNNYKGEPFYIVLPAVEDYEDDAIIEFSKRYFKGSSLELRVQLDRNYPQVETLDLFNFTKLALQKADQGWTVIDLPENHTENKQVEKNTEDIVKLNGNISNRQFKQVTLLSDIQLTDEQFNSVEDDKDEIAKLFKEGTLEGDNNYILRMNQFTTKDFHGFLPESSGGLLEVISVNSYTHRDPSNGEVFSDLPPAKEHRVMFYFYSDSGNTWSSTLNNLNEYFDFKKINSNEGGASQEDVDKNKGDISNLESSVQELKNLLKISYKDFEISYNNETLTLNMIAHDPDFDKKMSIVIRNDNPPTPDTFKVYSGWTTDRNFSKISTVFDSELGQVEIESSKDTVLEQEFSISRDSSEFKYTYIAFPSDCTDPPIEYVNYNGFNAEWQKFEQVVDGYHYTIFCSYDENFATEFNIKLVQ